MQRFAVSNSVVRQQGGARLSLRGRGAAALDARAAPSTATRRHVQPISATRAQDPLEATAAPPVAHSTSRAASPDTVPSVEPRPKSPDLAVQKSYNLDAIDWKTSTLSFVVVGASGDLAKKKIFPSLFALYYEGHLPENFQIFGYARSKMTDDEFRQMIAKTLRCRVNAEAKCNNIADEFLSRCFYQPGQYTDVADFDTLNANMMEKEVGSENAHRVFYLSIPPNVFVDAAQGASGHASSTTGFTRVIVEKPFGKDLESSRALNTQLKEHLTEDQIYRIDHYLGKELIENLTVLRFANLVFEPLWNRQYIRNVQVIFSEDFGTEGRGGYFDQYGIIRDVIQNHLIQIVALFAMEAPVSMDAEDIRDEKVKVLRAMKDITLDDVVVGQYRGRKSRHADIEYPSYTDDDTVPDGSNCPTFAAVAAFINNARWDGVPFLLKAGKALDRRYAEVRVQFRHVPGNLYASKISGDSHYTTNELVMRIQPDEGIYLKINNKVPGLSLRLNSTKLDLSYKAHYQKELPDAYERLILDVVNGDKRLFIRDDELEEAWKMFTPLLHDLEARNMQPESYPYGSRGPVGAYYLAAKHGVQWGDTI